MPSIRHSIGIEANPEKIYPLISTGSGFSKWWAQDVRNGPNETLDLGFFKRTTVYRLQLKRASEPLKADWHCLSGGEWKGTKLLFHLSKNEDQTVLEFSHANWKAKTEYLVSCNTTWGELMFRLKSAAENKPRGPLFSKNGWNP